MKHSTESLPGVAVYQMETLAVEPEAFGFVVRMFQLEIGVECFVACPYFGSANKI